jgi:hypothetical protein
MTDRRRVPRYSLCRTTPAHVGVLQDVLLTSANGNEVTVLSPTMPSRCDRLLMQVVCATGAVKSLPARVLRTAPVFEGGAMRFLVALQVDGFSEIFPANSFHPLG